MGSRCQKARLAFEERVWEHKVWWPRLQQTLDSLDAGIDVILQKRRHAGGDEGCHTLQLRCASPSDLSSHAFALASMLSALLFPKLWPLLTVKAFARLLPHFSGNCTTECRCTLVPKGTHCSKDSRGKGGLSKLTGGATIDVDNAFLVHQGVTAEAVVGAAAQCMSAVQADEGSGCGAKLSEAIPKPRTYYFAASDMAGTVDWVQAVQANIGATRTGAVVRGIEALLKELEVTTVEVDNLEAIAVSLYK